MSYVIHELGGLGATERSEAVKILLNAGGLGSGWGLGNVPVGTPTPRSGGVERIE